MAAVVLRPDNVAVKRRRLFGKTPPDDVCVGSSNGAAHAAAAPGLGEQRRRGRPPLDVASGRVLYKTFFWSYGKWCLQRVACRSWDASWPPPGVRALRAASHDARLAVLHAWGQDTTTHGRVKAWAFAYWSGKRADVGIVAVDPESASEWWRGPAVLLTWQGDWGVLQPSIELPFVDEGAGQRLQRLLPLPARGEETARAVDAEAEAQRADPRVRMVWDALQKLQKHVATTYLLDGVAVSLEICPETYMASRAVRMHAHMFIYRAKRFRIRHAADVMFLSSVPHKSQAQGAFCRARSASAAAGIYYLRCPKVGCLFSDGTLVPHVDFQVQPAWIWNLLSGGKMRREAARLEFVKQARDLPRLLAAFDKFVNENAAAELAAKIACVHAELALARRPFRRVPVVDEVALPFFGSDGAELHGEDTVCVISRCSMPCIGPQHGMCSGA